MGDRPERSLNVTFVLQSAATSLINWKDIYLNLDFVHYAYIRSQSFLLELEEPIQPRLDVTLGT